MAFYLWLFACQSEPTLNTMVPSEPSAPVAQTQELDPPSVAQAETPSTEAVQRMIYLTDQASLQTGQGELLKAVSRTFGPEDGPQAALNQLYLGPKTDESGLVLTACGTTGARILQIENGVAHVQLEGNCGGCGTHSIFDSIQATLKAWPEVTTVVGFGPNEPVRTAINEDKLPRCLEP